MDFIGIDQKSNRSLLESGVVPRGARPLSLARHVPPLDICGLDLWKLFFCGDGDSAAASVSNVK